jgi:hypothetical protein
VTKAIEGSSEGEPIYVVSNVEYEHELNMAQTCI